MLKYFEIIQDPSIVKCYKSRESIEFVCCRCEVIYQKIKHYALIDIRKGGVKNYCSRECSSLAQRNRTEIQCAECGKTVDKKPCEVRKVKRSFCSKSCGAKFNSKDRDPSCYEKIRQTWAKKPKTLIQLKVKERKTREKNTSRPPRVKMTEEQARQRRKETKLARKQKNIWGPYSKLFKCKCAQSGEVFYSRTPRKYKPGLDEFYTKGHRARYHFTFNVYHFPDLFDLQLVEQHGWYNTGGNGKRKKPINKSGVSRDHRISVKDAVLNDYEPYYIKHPLNCRIMLHEENKRKHTKSDLNYEDLVRMVDEYESVSLGLGPAVWTPGSEPGDPCSIQGGRAERF